ncbi:MAG TPA: ice-binding family protein [Burkholderiales bacterium]
MSRIQIHFKPLTSIAALLLTAFVAGCGGGGGGGGGSSSGTSAAALAAAAAGRTLTVAPGAGHGVGGAGTGPAPVDLMSILTNNLVILTKTGITNTGSHGTHITGNIGSSPITSAAMNTVFCTEIAGTIFGVDAAYVGSGSQVCFAGNPPASNKTLVDNAVLDQGTAYADAAGRAPDYVELGAGAIGGMTLPPAVYKWSTGVSILSDVFLAGGPNDVWILEIAGDITMASAVKVTLLGGALAKNVFWQAGGPTGVALGTTAHFEGVLLATKAVTVNTGATANGRFLSQTTVTLDANTIVSP